MSMAKTTNDNGHPVVTAGDGATAVVLYRMMMNWTSAAVVVLTVGLAISPSNLINDVLGNAINWSLLHWQKLSTDYLVLSKINADIATQYTALNALCAALTDLSVVLLGIPLSCILICNHQPLDTFHVLPRRHLMAISVFCLFFVWIFVIPSPFGSAYPTSVIALGYSALMWVGLQLFLTNILARFIKLIFGR